MDDHPDRGPYTGPRTGPVRIIGARRASGPAPDDAPTDEPPATGGPGAPGEPPATGVPGADDFGPEDWATQPEPALPHWTEAPTGEVPAVLARPRAGEEDDPWAGVPEPSWREERSDWDRADPLDAALWPGAGEGRPLAENDPSDREPWAFDLERDPAGEADQAGEDFFPSWEAAPAVPDRWEGPPRTGEEPVVLDEHDLDELDALDARWASDDEDWDPDLVAGEKTTVMRIPHPAEPAPRDMGRPRPHPAHAASGSGDGTGFLADPVVDEAPAEAWQEPGRGGISADEALAADLETRRGRRRRAGGRGAGSAVPPEAEAAEDVEDPAVAADAGVAPSLVVRAPGGHRPRSGDAGRTRTVGPGGERTATTSPAPARRGEDAMSQRAGRNMPAAIASGLVVGVLALVAFHFGTVPAMVVVSAVIGLAAVEAFAGFRSAGYHPATLLGLVAVVGLVVGTYDKTYEALPLVSVLLVAGTFAWHLAGVDRRADPVRSTAATLLVYAWVGVFGSFAALLLSPSLFPDRHGVAYLLGALIAAVAYDVGALAVGAWLGRRPLSHVSPGKTWEGVIGGAVAAIVLSVGVVHLIHPWTLTHALALGIVVAVVSPIGDLCESMVKRHLGLKDMGRILPGHGGVLDRVDGLLFVLPATFYLVRAFHGG